MTTFNTPYKGYSAPTRRRHGRYIERQKFAFIRDLLPTPLDYYVNHQGLILKGHGDWRDVLCPFHDDSNPSLRVNIRIGCFRCMVCDTKGSDVIAFHRARTGLSFVETCKVLGAWGEV
jgi:hypothetical protein